ncbi:nitrate regulatory protein [Pantoea ananatis]|uniref:nitrate regulatory protein n=1 Tax=Pantoea ananas TaxID=553 RepID=UPI0007DADD80|nr:nitrate regulatory protein [Pantoea ananatis]MCW0350014.1 Nitrate regulatory protein [Pantoea ananatis]UYL00294.1 nitrate- and nitrite sensing domain-containing protein [Pantoea ananatis]
MDDALSWLQASRQSDIASLERLRQTGKLITTVSELVHQLQRERGASNLWICSQGRLYGGERTASEQDVSRSQLAFSRALPKAEAQPGYSRFCNLIATALQALADLPVLRQKIARQDVTHAQAMAAFNAIIRSLLNLVFEAADTASHPEITRALIALFSFMQGKELTGQERAQGAAGFAAGQFTAEQRSTMVALIEAQEQSFTTFQQFADETVLRNWQPLAQPGREIERLRRIACTDGRRDESGALHWFSLLSERIDQMKSLEDQLSAVLMAHCREAIALAQHQAGAPLSVATSGCDFTLYVSGADWLATRPTALNSEGLAPQLGRSLLSLIGEQSQHLQRQANELAAMRATLEERKLLDQAKTWLMQQHGLSEEKAWQTLRKSAMDQNKRLLEIAQAIVTVAATVKR